MDTSVKAGGDTPGQKGARDAGYSGEDLMKAAARRLRRNKPGTAQPVPTQSA